MVLDLSPKREALLTVMLEDGVHDLVFGDVSAAGVATESPETDHKIPLLSYWNSGGVRLAKLKAPPLVACGGCLTRAAITNCPSCDASDWYCYPPSYTDRSVWALQCIPCGRGNTFWTCSKCGKDNPVKTSLYATQNACFVATATMGSPDVWEVMMLREFRDNVLSRSRAGAQLISFYETASPRLAEIVAGSRPLQAVSRICLIAPAAILADFLCRRFAFRSIAGIRQSAPNPGGAWHRRKRGARSRATWRISE